MFERFKITKELLLLGFAAILLFIFFAAVLITSLNSPTRTVGIPSPTPTTSPFSLTKLEENFPSAKRQAFQVSEDTFTDNVAEFDTGTLVVTSKTPGVWVYLDPPEDAHAESNVPGRNQQHRQAPDQYPPFTVNAIPVGKHRLIAAQADFVATDIVFDIKKGLITRIVIDLKPVQRQ